MRKFLKFTVIFLGILIVTLFCITIFAIYNKYNNYDLKNFNSLKLEPQIEEFLTIKDFQIQKNLIHFRLENNDDNSQLLRTYNLRDGKLSTEIKIK